MLLIDEKYISLIGPTFDKFKKVRDYLYNCRCPYCGDSEKSEKKARGYFYRKKDQMKYKCHNCGICISFITFLKDNDTSYYKQYVMERYKPSERVSDDDLSTIVTHKRIKFASSIDIPTILSLDDEHPAKKYILSRKIPSKYLESLYYTDDFRKFSMQYNSEVSKELQKKEGRIVIPFIDDHNKILAFQGRSLSNSGLRYITIKLNEDDTKIFGLNTVDKNKPVLVVEGPIDSLFLFNCVASADSDLTKAGSLFYDPIYVYDNQPRNKEIVSKLKATIERKNKVVIFPKTIIEKDINDMIINGGYTIRDVNKIVFENIYYGLDAMNRFKQWKKI